MNQAVLGFNIGGVKQVSNKMELTIRRRAQDAARCNKVWTQINFSKSPSTSFAAPKINMGPQTPSTKNMLKPMGSKLFATKQASIFGRFLRNMQKDRNVQLCATEFNEFNLLIGFPESLFIKWVVNITVCKSILVAAPFMRTQALAKVEASIVSSPCSSTSILKNVSAFFMSMPGTVSQLRS